MTLIDLMLSATMVKLMAVICTVLALQVIACQADSTHSQCYGTTSNGALEGGSQLPLSGNNFIAYGEADILRHRVFVHTAVKRILQNSLDILQTTAPDKRFMYAETGFENGGSFPPHKTHQNGLSVDLMVPVTMDGKSAYLPTDQENRYGYDIEFDHHGQYQVYQLDFDALSAWLRALHQSALAQGYDVWRVFFAPDLQQQLFDSEHGQYLKQHLKFNQHQSWVRHDEHIHIDFEIPCLPLSQN